MSSQPQKLSLSKRWPIAFWFGAAFCFFIFPLFLIDVGLENMLPTRRELQKQQLYRDLGTHIEPLLQYSNSRHYYHSVLKKIHDIAAEQSNPFKYLKRAIDNLKKHNPEIFKFIVYDDKGAIIDNLTDEKGYRYILKTIHSVISEVRQDVSTNYPGFPENLAVVHNRLNLLRSYLGDFFIPENLNLPLLRNNIGECIMASAERAKSYFWFQGNDKFTMLVQISLTGIESSEYLKKLVTSINRNPSTQMKSGIADLMETGRIFTEIDARHKAELLLGLAKYENFSQQYLETDNFLMVVRVLTPTTRAFAFINKQSALINPVSMRHKILFSASAAILCLSALFIYLIIIRGHIFSIRLKLAVLFIYANGLPLMILGFIGYEYLQQTRRLLLDQAQTKISQLLDNFDSRFVTIKHEYASSLNNVVKQINDNYRQQQILEKDLKKLVELVNSTHPYDFMIIGKDSKPRLSQVTGKKAGNFFANMIKNILEFINYTEYTPQWRFTEDADVSGHKHKINTREILATRTIVFHRFLQNVGKINPEQMGSEGRQHYWQMLGDVAKRSFDYIIAASWNHHTIQEAYIKKNMESVNQNSGQIRCFAIIEKSGMTYPENTQLERSIFEMFRQAFNLKAARSDRLEFGNAAYAAFGKTGRQLNKVTLVGLFPLQTLEKQISELKTRLLIFALLSLSLTLGIGNMLSAQFMKPVKELENGVKAIGRQDFRYRLPITSEDEFGHLSNVFNNAITSLEDLEVARIVQENLFPQESLKQNNLEVFGKSVTMTRLGGDYYDFFALDESKTGVLMGDVAGHGVPAAMLMAMAKASVLLGEEEKHTPSLLLSSLHKVIHRVKSSKIKRMMTCQYFCIDSKSGEYQFSNAGHCFPAVIRNNGRKVELLELVGTPLGIVKKPRYENLCGSLEPGDIMLLYTDGIIESKNHAGIEMGFDNFTELLAREFAPDLDLYYQRIFKGYKDWAASADDDITMVLIKYYPKEAAS